MNTATAPQPTGYSTGKCPTCKTRIVAATETAIRCEGGYYGKVVIRCTTEGCVGQRYGVNCKRIMGSYSEKECGPKCTSAVGPSCDCKCGGKNHASGHHA